MCILIENQNKQNQSRTERINILNVTIKIWKNKKYYIIYWWIYNNTFVKFLYEYIYTYEIIITLYHVLDVRLYLGGLDVGGLVVSRPTGGRLGIS